jgi:hypothetical protein
MMHRLPDPVDDAIRTAGWITQGGPRHVKHVTRTGRRWTWEVLDEAQRPAATLAHGRALTIRGARRRAHRAYVRILHETGADS